MIDRIRNSRLLMTLLVLIILLVILLITRNAYAYLEPVDADVGTTEGTITSTGDYLYFRKGDPLAIILSSDDFSTIGQNYVTETHPSVTLIANAKLKNASANYTTGIVISKNTFNYTKADKPELILTVKDNTGNIVSDEVDGLTYTTVTDFNEEQISGYDITNAKGIFNIAIDREIASTDSDTGETHTWTYTLTFISYDFDQSINENAEFQADIFIQEEKMPNTYAETCTDEGAACKLTKASLTVADADKTLFYHDGEADYEKMANSALEAGDKSYRFSGSSEKVKNYVCLDGTETTVGECASDADLYRIIGFFPNESGEYEMKLIKATEGTATELGDNSTAEDGAYYGSSYFWNSSKGISGSDGNTNMWQYSNLNKVNLNEYYLNTYLAKVSGLSEHITEHDWTTGGLPYSSSYNAQQVYNKELGTEKLTTSDKECYSEDNNSAAQTCTEDDLTYKDAKIGLMYVSDYGYAAYPDAWNQYVPSSSGYGSEAVKENNWMFLGKSEWTVSRNSDYGYFVWLLSTGYANNSDVYSNWDVRPTFYLDSSTKITSGDGSKTNPFRLSWN